jgi:hypothetical protein
MLAQIRVEKSKTQGRLDGAVELIAGAKGYEFEKIGGYSTDTNARFLIISFKKEDPKVDTAEGAKPVLNLVESENPDAEHPHSDGVEKEEQPVGSN